MIETSGEAPLRVLEIGPGAVCRGGIASVIGVLCEGLPALGFTVTRLVTQDDRSAWTKLRSAFSGWARTFLSARRADVAHVHTASSLSFWRKSIVLLLLHLRGCPVVLHVHGGGFGAFMRQMRPGLRRCVFAPLVRRCKRVVVLSELTLAELNGCLPPVPMSVVGNPCMLPLVSVSRGQASVRQILFTGWIEEGKGVFELIRAFAALAQDHPELCLVLAGKGRLEDCRQLAQELRVADRVSLPGWLDRAQIAQAYAGADVFCLPSYIEGMPMSLLEAMGRGLPCVATPVGAVGELITDGQEGVLVPVGDVDALASALRRVIEDRALREGIAKHGLARIVRHHTQPMFCRQVADLLRAHARNRE